jgi:branched-chain amino acid transport system ATP-binding protein
LKTSKTILQVKEIETYYGLSHILFQLSLDIKEGEVLGLLGRNGAGKTTTIRSIVGLTPAKSGKIHFWEEDITRTPPYMIARKGIRAAFSDKRVFGDLTVRENLEIGKRQVSEGTGKKAWDYDSVSALFPVLQKYEKRWARTLSGGEQQMLCVASALMGNPELLLLDEPTIGLSPVVIDAMGEQIQKLKTEGMSILIAEQNIKFAMEMGNRFYIIDTGEVRFHGTLEELSNNDYVMRTYLAV